MWCAAELGLNIRRIDAGFTYGVVDTAEYLQMNPNGTIPTLQDGENTPIWESCAIMRYLSTQYAEESFWPSDPVARSIIDQWAEWAKINAALYFTGPIFWQVVRTPEDRQHKDAISLAVTALHNKLAIADRQLSNSEYLASNHFSLADIVFGHILYRYYAIDIERAELANLYRYYQLISARPYFQEHVAVSYEELVDTF